MSWQLYFHHSFHVLLKSCSLQSLGTVLGDTPPGPAQELLLINIPSPKPGAHLLHKTRSLSHREDWSHIFFPFATSPGISISMCLMSQACSPDPLGKRIRRWGNPASLSRPARGLTVPQAGVPGQGWHFPHSIP